MAAPARSMISRLTLGIVKQHLKTCNRSYSIIAPIWLGGRPHIRYEGHEKLSEPKKSLQERLEEEALDKADPELDQTVDIGEKYSPPKFSKEDMKILRSNRKNKELEKAARLRTIRIPIEAVSQDWKSESGPEDTQIIADHYGIYEHLFDGATFVPVLPLRVTYDYDDEHVTTVLRGNLIAPSEASQQPDVTYDAPDDSLWTLVLTNPDGHLTDNESEYLHWFVGNISGNDVSSGEQLVQYLQPFPPKGTGYHRHVFVLFKQANRIDYSGEKEDQNGYTLANRTFKMAEFYGRHADSLTPCGLSFFQSEWDESVREVYHHTLDMREPVFEYCHPPFYHPPQVTYPRKQPFDRYYDRYRDKKDLAEEVLRMKLDMITPFEQYKPEWKYPMVHRPNTHRPSWLTAREGKVHTKVEQFQDLPK